MHTSEKRQKIKIYSVGRTENHKLMSVIIPEGYSDSRCESKGIHWCQTSSNCFSSWIRQIYRKVCTVQKKKALD